MAPAADTVIFVDIDGVLNIGIRDHGNAPLLLDEQNCHVAVKYKDVASSLGTAERECVEKVAAVVGRQQRAGRGEGLPFRDLACASGRQCAEPLVRRLADILRKAGGRQSVVLSSNWRKPRHAGRVKALEKEVSQYLGRGFAFDASTELAAESCAADRLRCIGDYLRRLRGDQSQESADVGRPLRVLVLDDFFVTPFDGWVCEGASMRTPSDAEAYLQNCASEFAPVAVKVAHCYEEWETAAGLRVQVGSGLAAGHVAAARAFLAGGAAAAKGARHSVEIGKQGRRGDEQGADKEHLGGA